MAPVSAPRELRMMRAADRGYVMALRPTLSRIMSVNSRLACPTGPPSTISSGLNRLIRLAMAMAR